MTRQLSATIVRLELEQIRLDGGTQIRQRLNGPTVAEYAEQMAAGAEFPPLVVYHDGADYWLADGYHRLAAAGRNGATEIECEVRQGDRRDAVLAAVGANQTHGLRRTAQDKRRAVGLLLADAEWSRKSDRWIAEACGVSPTFVGAIRNQLSTMDSCGDDQPRKEATARIGRDGKVRRDKAKARAPEALKTPAVDPAFTALAAREDFDSVIERLGELRPAAERLAKMVGNEYLTPEAIRVFEADLDSAMHVIDAARPQSRCRDCQGRGCRQCQYAGYYARSVKYMVES